jgi:hypothetical protein
VTSYVSTYRMILRMFLQRANDSPMIRQWFANDSPMIHQWFDNDSTMIRQWFDNDSIVIRQWFANDSTMIRQWFDNDSPMIRQWFANDSHMKIPLFRYEDRYPLFGTHMPAVVRLYIMAKIQTISYLTVMNKPTGMSNDVKWTLVMPWPSL